MQCDASVTGVGAALFQVDEDGNERRPIAYMSQILNSAQRKYTITELECLEAITYIEEIEIKIVTYHASLKWFMSQKDLNGRLARWNFSIEHRKGSENIVPDALSRIHVDEISLNEPVLNIDLNSFKFIESCWKTITDDTTRLPDLKIVNNKI